MEEYIDILTLLSTIQNREGEQIAILIDEDVLNSELTYTDYFQAEDDFYTKLRKGMSSIMFICEHHGYDRSDIEKIYNSIGREVTDMAMNKEKSYHMFETKIKEYVRNAYVAILNKANPTVKDILELYGIAIYPIKHVTNNKDRK